MSVRITWKRLPGGDIEETRVVSSVTVRTIPRSEFNSSKNDINTAHQARLNRIARDDTHLKVMQAAVDIANDGESVFVEYADSGGNISDFDDAPAIRHISRPE